MIEKKLFFFSSKENKTEDIKTGYNQMNAPIIIKKTLIRSRVIVKFKKVENTQKRYCVILNEMLLKVSQT